jgi:hypothetical protein
MKTETPLLALLCLTLALPLAARAGDEPGEGPPPFRMPPQEAIAACASLALDAACTFTFDGRPHEGTCRRGPGGEGPIACAPDRRPGGPGGERGPGGDGGSGGERGKSAEPRKS